MTDQQTAKAKVLDWVRSKNPQTMELKEGVYVECPYNSKKRSMYLPEGCIVQDVTEEGYRTEGCSCCCTGGEKSELKILGSDMGLSETMNALSEECYFTRMNCADGYGAIVSPEGIEVEWDTNENLHQQDESFYEAILPLIT